MRTEFNSVDEYILSFPENIQKLLYELRETILENAPGVVENISYGMPAYKLYGKPLVYFAGYKNHIGFYATPVGHAEFKNQLSGYRQRKGSVQFPNNQPLPIELIKEIVLFRVKGNMLKPKKK